MVTKKVKSPNGNELMCDGNILYYTISKPVDAEDAMCLHNVGTDYINKEHVSLALIDIQRSTQFPSAARKIWADFLKNPRIKKAAIFGGNIFVRTLASFVIAAVGKKNIKFFSTEREAFDWLHA